MLHEKIIQLVDRLSTECVQLSDSCRKVLQQPNDSPSDCLESVCEGYIVGKRFQRKFCSLSSPFYAVENEDAVTLTEEDVDRWLASSDSLVLYAYAVLGIFVIEAGIQELTMLWNAIPAND